MIKEELLLEMQCMVEVQFYSLGVIDEPAGV